MTHPADLRARRERARKRLARAVHVIFENSKFQINSDVSPLYALMQQLYRDSTTTTTAVLLLFLVAVLLVLQCVTAVVHKT